MLKFYEFILIFCTILVLLKLSIRRIALIRDVTPYSLLRNSKVFVRNIMLWPFKEAVAKFIPGYSAPLSRKRCLYNHGFANLKSLARNSIKKVLDTVAVLAACVYKGGISKTDKKAKG